MTSQIAVIYCSANDSTGYGHFYRSLFFVKNHFPDVSIHMCGKIDSFLLDEYHLFIDQYVETNSFEEFFNDVQLRKPKYLILDDYSISFRQEYLLKKVVNCLVTFDDLVSLKCAHIVVNPTLGVKRLDYLGKDDDVDRYILGDEAKILRMEFYQTALRDHKSLNTARKIFMCFGGADRSSVGQKIINTGLLDDFEITWVVPNSKSSDYEVKYSHISKLRILSSISAQSIVTEMVSSDLCIVPASGLFNEAYALRVPVLLMITSENQELRFRKAFGLKGVRLFGRYDEKEFKMLCKTGNLFSEYYVK